MFTRAVLVGLPGVNQRPIMKNESLLLYAADVYLRVLQYVPVVSCLYVELHTGAEASTCVPAHKTNEYTIPYLPFFYN